MRVWVDLTNSPHVLVMRPVVAALEADGHEVEVTARDFAQTLGLLRRFGMRHTAIGAHGGGRVGGKLRGLVSRSRALAAFARGRDFDLALGHGSNDVSIAARRLGIPAATAFDYEWAAVQHHVNCRLCRAVVVPDAIPPERLARYGARGKLRRYPGLKEEYYLADFEPDPAVLDELGLDRSAPLAVARTAPEVSLYHRFEAPLFRRALEALRGTQTVVLPRTPAQREELARQPWLTVPDGAVDAQSLIAFADVVLSGGGTMNREAVALGTPVYTSFEGRLGAVDEALIRERRLRRLEDPGQLRVEKRTGAGRERIRRDPRKLTNLLLSALD